MAKVTVNHRGSEIDYVIEDNDLAEVEDAIDRIERNYHPVGYGTSFRKPEQRADGSWISRGHRWTSCD